MSNSTKPFIVKSSRPTAAQVRAWGAEQNPALPGSAKGTRGRLNPALVAAYNKAHKGGNAYSEKDKAVSSVTVTAKPAKGRAKTARVNVAEARKAAAAQGLTVGKRGRLPQAVLNTLVLG